MKVLAVNALVACSLAAFGSVYLWAAVPAMLGCVAVAAALRIRLSPDTAGRAIDRLILILLAAIALQLLPLPHSLLSLLSPHVSAFYAALLVGYRADANRRLPAHAISIEPPATLYALGLVAAVVLLFWAVRTLLAAGGTRRLVRGVIWIGLAVSLEAIVQRAASPTLVYGFWQPLTPNVQPIGPFVNRNHYATWMALAIPLTAGFLMGGLRARHEPQGHIRWIVRIRRWMEAEDLWYIIALCTMTGSLFMSLSRSGMVGFTVGMLAGAAITRHRMPPGGRKAILIYAGLAMVAILAWSDPTALLERLDQTVSSKDPGRLVVWGETLRVFRDFWLTGTGAGTYQTAMLVYQEALRGVVYFNHAHNHYLQVAAEGGLLLLIPVAGVLFAFARVVRERLRTDEGEMFWIRAGAASGLLAVAVQSVWETGLRMPANAILCAVVAAIAVHQPAPPQNSGSTRTRGT